MTHTDAVSWNSTDQIFTVQLNKPPANALGLEITEGLGHALDAFDASDDLVLVVVSALDGFFAAGADIKLMGTFTAEGGAEQFAEYGEKLRAPLNRLYRSDRPSIAAIEGRALGGGLELAMACTLRVGSESALLGLPESRLGLIPGAGGTQRLPRLVGRGRALDIMLTAREVPAAEAYAMGLLDRLVEPGSAAKEATTLAQTLHARSGHALTAIMRCVDDAQEIPLDDGLAKEAERINALYSGDQAQEGLNAFLNKRKPEFT